jgi:hypothetical protein
MKRKRVLYLSVGAAALLAVAAVHSGIDQTVFAQGAGGATKPAAGAQPAAPARGTATAQPARTRPRACAA